MPEENEIVAPEGIPTETPAIEPEQNWLLSMPEDLQNDNLLNEVKSVEDLARRFTETKRWADGRVKLPDENTPPDELSKFYNRLGVPENPAGYEFSKVDIPAAVIIEPDQLETFKKVFHDAKLTKAQADKIQSEYLKSIGEQHNKLVAEYTADMEQKAEVLKSRWGDQYDSKLDLARRYFSSAPPAVQAYVERNGLGNDADFIEWMYSQGVSTSEDTLRTGGSPPMTQSLDQEIKTVDAQLNAMAVSGKSQQDPEYKELLEKRDTLYKQRWPQAG